jgi:hypothetical protein
MNMQRDLMAYKLGGFKFEVLSVKIDSESRYSHWSFALDPAT